MATIGTELEARRGDAAKCRSCGTCRSVCPVFAEIGLENAVARGKVSLIRAVLDGDLGLTAIFDEKIQLCLNCKACRASCPNDVPVDDLILAARSGLVEAGRLPFLKRVIMRQLLRRGRLLPPVGRLASFFQRVVLRGLPQGSALRVLLPVVGFDRDRVFPEFAPRAFLSTVPEMVPAAAPAAAGVPNSAPAPAAPPDPDDHRSVARNARRVAFFVGCATNLIYTETGRAIVDALTRSGVDVAIPHGQGCCATPVTTAGDLVTARAMARKNIEVLRGTGADAVVTGCASCGLTLKREYEEILGIDGGVGMPVFDFTEFLAYRGVPRSSATDHGRIRVTYHEPCQLVRGQEITAEPREVLRSLPWVEFVELRDSDRCCGGSGTFSLTYPDLSLAIGKRKAEAIREAGVDVVATECQSCVMQLRDMLGRADIDVTVLSVAEVIALGQSAAAPSDRSSGDPARATV